MKKLLVPYCTFKGSPRFHCVSYIIIKVCVGILDPKEDLLEKELFSIGSC